MSKEMPNVSSLGDALNSFERRPLGDRAGSGRNDVIPATKGKTEAPVDPELFRTKMEQCVALIEDPLQSGFLEKYLGDHGLLQGDGARKALRIFDQFIAGNERNDFSLAQFQGLVARSENYAQPKGDPENVKGGESTRSGFPRGEVATGEGGYRAYRG
jgi:hypothetical protein